MVTELQISKVTRIFEFHSKIDISRKNVEKYMNICEGANGNFRKQFSHRVLSENQEKFQSSQNGRQPRCKSTQYIDQRVQIVYFFFTVIHFRKRLMETFI